MSTRLPYSLWDKKPDSPVNIIIDKRNELDFKVLKDEISSFKERLEHVPLLLHHIEQFEIIVTELPEKLFEKQSDEISEFPNNLMFESLVIGVLASQWSLLRNVSMQHNSDFRNFAKIEEIEKKAANYYFQLYEALPKIQEKLPTSPPLAYAGKNLELAILSQPNAPAVISVPIGALDSMDINAEGAIAHETAHAVFSRIPSFLEDLINKVDVHFSEKFSGDNNKKALLRTVLGWVEEMVADCVGTVFEGVRNGESVIWVTILPEQFAGLGSETHPPFPLRPISHLTTLNYLAKKFPEQNYSAQATELSNKIEGIYGDLFSYRFESIQALDVITLVEVKVLMINVLDFMLEECELPQLENKTLGEIFVKIIGIENPTLPAPLNWGREFMDEGYVLEFPAITYEHLSEKVRQRILALFGAKSSNSAGGPRHHQPRQPRRPWWRK